MPASVSFSVPAKPLKSVADATRLSAIPPRLYKPILRAYALALLSTTSLQLVRLIPPAISRKNDLRTTWQKVLKTLSQASSFESFPTYSAILIGASTLAPDLILDFISSTQQSKPARRRTRRQLDPVVRFCAIFAASWGVFRVLNRRSSDLLKSTHSAATYAETVGSDADAAQQKGREDPGTPLTPRRITPPPEAGKTLFLTSFGFINASVVLCSLALERYARNPATALKAKVLRNELRTVVPPVSFIISSALIMWTWIYSRERLPRDYGNWIANAAQADERLLDAIRKCHKGMLRYSVDTGVRCYLPEMARDLGYPMDMGDHITNVPIPCELYHNGTGSSCEWHAALRFAQGWKFAFRMYLPLNMLVLLRKKLSREAVQSAVFSAARSSTFLGAFIGLFYYGACFFRSTISPLIWSGKNIDALTVVDGTSAIAMACFSCGWSIFIEKPSRSTEMALFVAPRALSAILPLRYNRSKLWREQLVFALSAATILSAAHAKPQTIHGVFGRLLTQVYR